MKANELRIGNWITIYGVPDQVEGDWIANIQKANISGIILLDGPSPIPLTGEWLERFGSTDVLGRFCFDNIELVQSGGDPFLWEVWYDWEYADKKVLIAEIKYVHQFQNLYFALKDKEIELKK